MKRILLATLLVSFLPAIAGAQNNIGSCGWGSKLFDGQKGIAPQVLGATTNGTSGNQTFAVTSGTSGCTQDGVVTTSWKTAAFLDANMNKVAADISRGQGQSLDSLAQLMQVDQADQQAFRTALQQNFSSIFPNSQVNSEQVRENLAKVLASDATLAQYAARV